MACKLLKFNRFYKMPRRRCPLVNVFSAIGSIFLPSNAARYTPTILPHWSEFSTEKFNLREFILLARILLIISAVKTGFEFKITAWQSSPHITGNSIPLRSFKVYISLPFWQYPRAFMGQLRIIISGMCPYAIISVSISGVCSAISRISLRFSSKVPYVEFGSHSLSRDYF